MIRLTRAAHPVFLTPEKINDLTTDFKVNGNSVWNDENIKIPLLASSHGKCAYCECPLTTESNYMEVEHFEDKKNNPGKVVIWENLLPSCKKCNGSKSTHDVLKEPILNPYVDDPKSHIAFRLFRLRGITEKGKSSIDVTDLNDSDRLVFVRFKIGEKLDELLEKAYDRYEAYRENICVRTRNRFVSVVAGLLKECQPTSNYSATTATLLLTDRKFLDLVNIMKADSIWSAELEDYYQSAKLIVLDCV